MNINEPDLEEYELPFNWKKQCKRRKSGNTWDVYITHGSSGKKFRSNVAINDYLTNNPEVKCNRELTNCKYRVRQSFPEPSGFQYSERTIASTETNFTSTERP